MEGGANQVTWPDLGFAGYTKLTQEAKSSKRIGIAGSGNRPNGYLMAVSRCSLKKSYMAKVESDKLARDVFRVDVLDLTLLAMFKQVL